MTGTTPGAHKEFQRDLTGPWDRDTRLLRAARAGASYVLHIAGSDAAEAATGVSGTARSATGCANAPSAHHRTCSAEGLPASRKRATAWRRRSCTRRPRTERTSSVEPRTGRWSSSDCCRTWGREGAVLAAESAAYGRVYEARAAEM